MENNSFFDDPSIKLKIPLSLVPKCGLCGYHKGCKRPKQKVQGRGNKKILIVADWPDDERGGFLNGDEKVMVEKILAEQEISLERDCWTTGALICKPDFRHDKKDATEYCRPNLMREIQELEPNVVILLGEYALEIVRLLWKDEGLNFESFLGWQIPGQKINAWFCPTWHPKDIKKETNWGKAKVMELIFARHLTEAVAKRKKKPWDKVPDFTKGIKLAYNDEQVLGKFVQKVLRPNNPSPIIAFDYETNMLKPDNPNSEIICFSVSDGDETLVFNYGKRTAKFLKGVLKEQQIGKIASNKKFEHRWSKRILGVNVRGWFHDTMLAAHVLDNRGGISSIKFQSFVRLGQPDYSSHIEKYLKSKESGGYAVNRIKQAPHKPLMLYCGLDSLLEYKVAFLQRKEMHETPS